MDEVPHKVTNCQSMPRGGHYMPDRTIDLLLFRFLQQNGGTLSRRARTNEFKALTDDEIAQLEHVFAEIMIKTALPTC